MITTKMMFDKSHDHLDPDVPAQAYTKLKSCTTGKWLTDYLDPKVVVEINFVTLPTKIPGGGGKATGFCDPVPRGAHYTVWVAAGFNGTAKRVECPNGHKSFVPDEATMMDRFICKCGQQTLPGMELVDRLQNRPGKEVAKTTFHELLHAWFMTEFPNGTGHDASIEAEVEAFGTTTYSSHGIDDRFLAKLKQFDKEI